MIVTISSVAPQPSPIADRLARFREAMTARGWAGYFVPAADPHQSEYVPECWKRREFLSGFTGSSGDLLIGLNRAWLWTDSRYFIQAEEQLAGTDITLCRLGVAGSPSPEQILSEFFGGHAIAVDPLTILPRDKERLTEALKRVGGTLVLSEANLVDTVWGERPPLPTSPLEVFPLSCAGLSVMEKLALLREELAEFIPPTERQYAHPVTSLDAVAWLFNIRAHDIPFNPLPIAFALITTDAAVLYLTATNLPSEVRDHLAAAGVTVRPYDTFLASLSEHQGVWIVDPMTTNLGVFQTLSASNARVIRETSPITFLKAVKNPVEQAGMRAAHLRDAVAVVQLLHWLATAPADEPMTEITVGERLEEFRAMQPSYRGPSFPTIAGFGSHGAIVHYGATRESAYRVDCSAMLLLDSGCHYRDGTTDITRTIHRGTPTSEEAERYTLVLKGHLALARAVFPAGTDGCDLDALARAPLWRRGLTYGHGTGHGVGCYLSVHEGPQRIAIGRRSTPLVAGMIVSNEPGFYKAGSYGIRIENLEQVIERPDLSSREGGEFLGFETLTVVPYCRRLIRTELLTGEEREQIDTYHQRVLTNLSPVLSQPVVDWLKSECAPLE